MHLRTRKTNSATSIINGNGVNKKPGRPGKPVKGGRPAGVVTRATAKTKLVAAARIDINALRRKLTSKLHMDATVIDTILATILVDTPKVSFDEIIGQDEAVKSLRERVVYPALNPEVRRCFFALHYRCKGLLQICTTYRKTSRHNLAFCVYGKVLARSGQVSVNHQWRTRETE